MTHVVIVSNRLPVSVKKVDGKLEFFPSVGGLATGLSSYVQNRRNKWIGWPGISSDELTDNDKYQITKELAKHNCVPVFLTRTQLDYFYNGYSNSVLWPLFHSLRMPQAEKHDKWWRAYRAVNRLFAEATLAHAERGGIIWVHDYQLMLLPHLLRQEGAAHRIGFFLHIPFPEHRIYQRLPEAKKLLQGVLGAELAGFHTTGYVANFMEACERFGFRSSALGEIAVDERIVRVTDFPMGIDYDKYAKAGKSPLVKAALKKYKARYAGYRLIVAVDRLDPSKGLVERLQAYRQFLEQNPRLRGKVVFSMVASPSRTDIAAYKNLKKRLDKLVEEINGSFGTRKWQPIDYINESIPFEEVTALLRLADVAFIAPLRDGMNLVAKEFVASAHKEGALILSETAGAAQELRDAFLVDPRKPASVAAALHQALTMPKRELRQRLKRMQRHLAANTVHTWATDFIQTLNQPVPGTPHRTLGLRDSRRRQLVAAYKSARRRLILLDYDGTLMPLSWNYEKVAPSPALLKLLEDIASDRANEVVLISGRSRDDLDEWLSDLPISLVAEHSAFMKKAERKWQATAGAEAKWKPQILPILEKYAALTPKAAVEEKGHALVWHYRQSPSYYAQKHAVILKRILKPVVKEYGLEIFNGSKILEIKDPNLNKGKAIGQWLTGQHDFILAIGDDYTDEDMFEELPDAAYSIKVGPGRTSARFRVGSYEDIRQLLSDFCR